jgi:uncharacterized membrane protein YwaF
MAKGDYLEKFGGSRSGYEKGRKSGFVIAVIILLILGIFFYLVNKII